MSKQTIQKALERYLKQQTESKKQQLEQSIYLNKLSENDKQELKQELTQAKNNSKSGVVILTLANILKNIK